MTICRCNTLVRGPIHCEHDYRCAGDLRAELEKLRDEWHEYAESPVPQGNETLEPVFRTRRQAAANFAIELCRILASGGCGRQFTAKEFAIGVQYGKPEQG